MSEAALKVGSIVRCRVDPLPPFPAVYASSPEGHKVYINLPDLSWGPISGPQEVVAEGEYVDVKILGHHGLDPSLAIGSLREVRPEDNPWRDPSRYRVGDLRCGIVVNVLSYGAFVRLEEGAVILVQGFERGTIELGQKLGVELIEVDPEHQAITAEIIAEL